MQSDRDRAVVNKEWTTQDEGAYRGVDLLYRIVLITVLAIGWLALIQSSNYFYVNTCLLSLPGWIFGHQMLQEPTSIYRSFA